MMVDPSIIIVLEYTIEHSLLEYIDGLVQERLKSIANALESPLSCTEPTDISYDPLPHGCYISNDI